MGTTFSCTPPRGNAKHVRDRSKSCLGPVLLSGRIRHAHCMPQMRGDSRCYHQPRTVNRLSRCQSTSLAHENGSLHRVVQEEYRTVMLGSILASQPYNSKSCCSTACNERMRHVIVRGSNPLGFFGAVWAMSCRRQGYLRDASVNRIDAVISI